MSRFSKINVGDTVQIIHTITDDDVEKFINLSGDNNRLHVEKKVTINYSAIVKKD